MSQPILLQKESMEIFFIKLVSGDEIIAEVEDHDEDDLLFKLINPLRIVNYMQDGVMYPSFHPFVFGNFFDEFLINKMQVCIITEAGPYLTELYCDFLKNVISNEKEGSTIH